MKLHRWVISFVFLLLFNLPGNILGRTPIILEFSSNLISANSPTPAYCYTRHTVGNLGLVVQNNGSYGIYRRFYSSTGNYGLQDCITGNNIAYGAEFPARSKIEHIGYSGIWVGAVSGPDTLVSTGIDGWSRAGAEMHPDATPTGDIIKRSIVENSEFFSPIAVSEEDIITTYYDTLHGTSNDFFASRRHIPMGLEIKQRSYAWGYSYSQDLVIVDLEITNRGMHVLEDIYIGIYVNGDVGFQYGYQDDDLAGLLRTYPARSACDFLDTLDIAWIADNDGDPVRGEYLYDLDIRGVLAPPLNNPGIKSATNIIGTKVLRTPDKESKMGFNWWTSNYYTYWDFGPRRKDNFRDYRTGGLGTPEGDLNKYNMMSSGEIDYDQVFTFTVGDNDQEWISPNRWVSYYLARGMDTQFLLSYGPFRATIGETLPFTFAFVGGQDFHFDPTNYQRLPWSPDAYYDNVNFYGLVKSARHAKWIFDNPGVDTNGDGFRGRYRVCGGDSTLIDGQWVYENVDTTYYEGDGTPDFRGASPPPVPEIKVTPLLSGVRLTFNGQESERTFDHMSNTYDFEGYRVYTGLDDRPNSFSMIASYDRENWDKYVFNPRYPPHGRYELHDLPYTEDSLRCLYGSDCDDIYFQPGNYGPGHPYFIEEYPDSMFYFVKHGDNTDEWGTSTTISRVYPEYPIPPLDANLDTLDLDWFTEEGMLKCYEYQFEMGDLLASVPHWISVTTFDHGAPKADLEPLETSITHYAKMFYPHGDESQVAGDDLKVYVYPNPYRADENYRQHGYEGRTQWNLPDDKVRALHFANLPAKCKIQIYSLDGDLIRELSHDMPERDINSRYAHWDMISRNNMAIVSGLYYWVVEADNGTIQMGTFVVIM